MNALVRLTVVELGLDSAVLWLAGAIGLAAQGMAVGILAEWAAQVAMRQPYRATDGHGALIGLLLALMMPPTVPWWVLAVGVGCAIFVGKQVYGGIGGYPMHPAAVGWVILVISWPHHVTAVDTASLAAPNAAAIAATALGGLFLWTTGTIRIRVPAGVLLGVLAATAAFSLVSEQAVLSSALTGHTMLAAFFLATDATTRPVNIRAQWVYGIGVGVMIALIRAFGVWSDAVPFAILLMNTVTPLLDRVHPPILTVRSS